MVSQTICPARKLVEYSADQWASLPEQQRLSYFNRLQSRLLDSLPDQLEFNVVGMLTKTERLNGAWILTDEQGAVFSLSLCLEAGSLKKLRNTGSIIYWLMAYNGSSSRGYFFQQHGSLTYMGQVMDFKKPVHPYCGEVTGNKLTDYIYQLSYQHWQQMALAKRRLFSSLMERAFTDPLPEELVFPGLGLLKRNHKAISTNVFVNQSGKDYSVLLYRDRNGYHRCLQTGRLYYMIVLNNYPRKYAYTSRFFNQPLGQMVEVNDEF